LRAASVLEGYCEVALIQQTEERLVLKTDTLAMEMLPALGGKIASLRCRGIELLQAPLRPYAERNLRMGFDESDASGIDECLPSVSACEITGRAGTVAIPDHGEFWRLPCQTEQRGPDEMRMTATGSVLPLRFERTLKLDGGELQIAYRLKNVGEGEVPYVWSAHPLFSVDAGDAIVLPSSVRKVRVEGSAHERLGTKGEVHNWPVTELHSSEKVDLSLAGDVSDNIGDKLYTAAPQEGWASIERRRYGLRVQVGFDPGFSAYLGLWLCYGGWPEGQARRQQCVAIEPCTAPEDSLATALEKGWAKTLNPGETAVWRMTIGVSEIV
jgi:galactose mutarotase-like enzyme